MLQATNYCRQMVKQFTSNLKNPLCDPSTKAFMRYCINLAQTSQKFLLPDGGVLYDDPEYKALDENVPLSLPFPVIAIEFTRSPEYLSDVAADPGHYQPHKALFFARERADSIAVTVIPWAGHSWCPYPEVAVPRVRYLDRATKFSSGRVGIAVMKNDDAFFNIPLADYADEIGVLLSMLNILQCRNVHVEKREVSKAHKAMAMGATAIRHVSLLDC